MKICGVILSFVVAVVPLLLLYSATVAVARHGQVALSPYILGEMLENYSAGFVRRGLLGAVIQHLTHHGSAVLFTTELIFWNYALFLIALLVLIVWRARLWAWTLPLIFLMPGGVFTMAFTHELYYRKEMFFYSGLAVLGLANACLAQVAGVQRRNLLARILLAATVAFSVFAALVHEAFLFLAAPATAFLFANAALELHKQEPGPGVAVRRLTGWFIAGNVLLFLLISVFGQGSPAKTAVIWNSFSPADRALFPPGSHGGLDLLWFPLKFVIRSQIITLFSGWAWYYLAPMGILFLYCATLVCLNEGEETSVFRGWASAYLTLFLCSLPLFLIGLDYGRWVNAVPVTFLILWLSLGSERLALIPLVPWQHMAKRSPTLSRFALLVQQALSDLRWTCRRHTTAVILMLLLICSTSHLHELSIVADVNYLPVRFVQGLAALKTKLRHTGPAALRP